MLTSEWMKAARALLHWSQTDLANASGVSLPTIKRLESKPGILVAHERTVKAMQDCLEAEGIQFLDNGDIAAGPGVAIKVDDKG